MKHALSQSKTSLPSLNWSTTLAEPLQASTWVKLQELPNPYSHDEALLLCQNSDTEWTVWIPDHGQMILHRCQLGEVC
ncbi:MAG: hypothetical protein WA828_02040 [Coleofasciculaceae cyanobacterium]